MPSLLHEGWHLLRETILTFGRRRSSSIHIITSNQQEEQDEIAYRSHMNAHTATEDGRLKAEINPLDGFDYDPLIRPTTTMEKLAKLPPVFDRSPSGTITAGNSSPLTDGAASVLLMSEARAQKEGREPLAFIKAFKFVGIDPKDGLLMGPGLAVPQLLKRTGKRQKMATTVRILNHKISFTK